jgi:hypothetical protein
MQRAGSSIAIGELRAWLDRVEGGTGTRRDMLRFGVPELDLHLPAKGLALGSLHEIIEAGAASEYACVAVLFAAGIAARLKGPVVVPKVSIRSTSDVKDVMFVDLGGLRAFKGSQRYPIPADVDLKDYQSVIIWCERFGVLISPADLTTVVAAR